MMSFNDAFDTYIKDQPITTCDFRLLQRVMQPNGFFAEIGGYCVQCKNGYSLIFSGASLGNTAIQEALIIDADNMIIARDTDDLRWPVGKDPYL